MSRSASSGVPGYLTVSGAGQVLHLAPRSIRDLIYTRRLASVRLGRRHFLNVADIDAERRRRLGRAPRRPRAAHQRPHSLATLPFAWQSTSAGLACGNCGRPVEAGEPVLTGAFPVVGGGVRATCGRRTLLMCADQRTQQAGAARRLARAIPSRGESPALAA